MIVTVVPAAPAAALLLMVALHMLLVLQPAAAAAATAAPCNFTQGLDCSGIVTPPGFMRNFGTGAAARQKCCDACARSAACAVAVLAEDQRGVCMLKPHGTRCSKAEQPRLGCLPAGYPVPPAGHHAGPHPGPPPPGPPPLVPKWTPTFNMSESTVIMPCNYTGLYDYDAYPDLAKFGLVDYDWSNAKKTWANQSPMDADGMLVKQAARNKAANPSAKVFVYRNIVKALVSGDPLSG
eukprot:SAG22_NODE_1201_length_5182_cov_3.788904_5_plen_237_part_00